MVLIILLVIAALAVSGSAAFFSVYGLAHTFPFAFMSLIVLGSSLEFSKLVVASFIYRFWKKINIITKAITVLLTGFLMVLTSIGIFGYLNAAYQAGSIDNKDIQQKIEVLSEQKTKYEQQLTFIDNQIEKSPEKFVSKKIQLIKTLQAEKKQVMDELTEVNKQRNLLMSKQIESDSKIGPIVFIAKAVNLPVDNAIGYLIALIMIVFDPLAITLTIAANIAISDREYNKKLALENEGITPQPNPQPVDESDLQLPTVSDVTLPIVSESSNKHNERQDIINSVRKISS